MGNPQLFVIGDSISMHYGPYLQQSLAGQLTYARKGDLPGETELDANGRDSKAVLDYGLGLISQKMIFEVLLVNCGLHDIKRIPPAGEFQVAPEVYQANLARLAQISSQLSPKVIWVSTTPVDDSTHNRRNPEFQRYNRDAVQYNQIAAQVMQSAGVPIIDLYQFTARLGQPDDLYEDHIHYREPIRNRQGAYLAGCIRLLLS